MIFPISKKESKEKNKLLFFFLETKGKTLTKAQKDFYIKELENELRDFYFTMPPITLSANALSQHLGVSHYKVIKWIKSGDLPANKVNKGHYEINLQDAEVFLKRKGFFHYFQHLKKPFLF